MQFSNFCTLFHCQLGPRWRKRKSGFVNDFRLKNDYLQKTLSSKESLSVTLAGKEEELVNVQSDIKQLKASSDDLRLYAKNRIDDKDKMIQ